MSLSLPVVPRKVVTIRKQCHGAQKEPRHMVVKETGEEEVEVG